MRQRPRTILAAAVLVATVLAVISLTGIAQAPEFEVASIRRNVDPKPISAGVVPNTPKGEIRLVAVPPRLLVLQAYPADAPGVQVDGLPPWATSERYDVMVRGRPEATAGQLAVDLRRPAGAAGTEAGAHHPAIAGRRRGPDRAAVGQLIIRPELQSRGPEP